jgi:alpha/beta superfamily hydrolase
MPETPHRSHLQTIDDLRGPAGRLEALLNTGRPDAPFAALVAHPHPLGGGTMHNKVVYHAAKAFSTFGLPVLRFNFRGTGLSEGTHDDGRGELDDIHAALHWLTAHYPVPILFAGFSFGSYVGLRACSGDPRVKGLIGLGLPVRSDAFSPRGVLEAVLVSAPEPKQITWVEGADHFFAGTPQSPASKLAVMSEALRIWLAAEFAL